MQNVNFQLTVCINSKINSSGTHQACFLKLELRALASATKQGLRNASAALCRRNILVLCVLIWVVYPILFVFSVYKLIQIGLNCLQLTN